MLPVWQQFRQGSEHKKTSSHTRMGQGESFTFDVEIVKKKQIKIKAAVLVALRVRVPFAAVLRLQL